MGNPVFTNYSASANGETQASSTSQTPALKDGIRKTVAQLGQALYTNVNLSPTPSGMPEKFKKLKIVIPPHIEISEEFVSRQGNSTASRF